ncbi:MAG TPA: COX aromatic rich motif-containing protein [Candidatus Paceibacterota bacterium]|nr:COX aromatic rich motif-containing protein [Candidatus Paceibacterota bacterium]
MSRFSVFLLCAGVALLVVATVIYAQHANIAILDPAGPVALAERNIIFTTLLLCALVVVPVFVMLFAFSWRYREGGHAALHEHHSEWDHYNWVAEVVWWVVPAIIIFILGIIAWQSSHALDPYKPLQANTPSMTIDVVALDWKWLFIYPEQGIASVNLVEFPVGTPVHFYLTADAPMNSFWIPQLGGQIMAMPGMTTQLNLMASRTGDFNGFSGNISGDGFSGMAFTARAVPQTQFDQWVTAAKTGLAPLTESSYASLAQPTEYNPVSYYWPVSVDLFGSVENKYMTPGSGMMMDPASTADGMQGMNMTP